MLKKLTFIFACIVMLQFPVKATHLSGMDLTYKHISGNQYEITLKYYRDCIGIPAATSASIHFESSCGADFDFTLPKISVTEISVPCNNQATTCNGGNIPGYQLHLFMDTVTIPHTCANWILSYDECCRNCAITTTSGGCSDNLYIEAKLDNTGNLNNNSPSFTNNPIAFMCLNQAFNYNHGVVDPDGDSLVFSLVNPLTTSGPVTFIPPYSAANFMSSSSGVSFSQVTGSLNLTPNLIQVAIAAVRVDEYRNGVLIGYVKRDLQFIVQSCSGNQLPTASGLNNTNNYSAVICAGDSVCFDIFSDDADTAQNVTMTVNNPIVGSTFTVTPGQHPTGTFCWKPGAGDSGNLNQFFVTVQDNACPTNGIQIFTYTIMVSHVTVSAVANNDDIDATASGGTPPYDYLWSNGATTEDLNDVANGTYTIVVTDDNGCTGTASATVNVNPCDVKVTMSKTRIVCWGDCTGTATANPFDGNAPYSFLWSNGQTGQTATGLCKGSYSVVVTDVMGCTVAGSVKITQNKRIKNTMTVEVDCDDYCDSELTANPTGGKPPYTYLWSTGQTTQHIDKLCDGSTYSVIITDSKGCTRSFSKMIPACPSPINNGSGNNSSKLALSDIGSVLPNPSSDEFALILKTGEVHVQIMDLAGRVLVEIENVSAGEILIGKELIPGIYLLHISNGITSENIQLVKTE